MGATLKEQFADLMGMFNAGSIFGIDIGAHSIKVCEISGAPGKYKVERFGTFILSEAAIIEDEIQKPSEIAEGLAEAMSRAGISSNSACLGLYGPNTMSKRMSVPEGTSEEIEDHIMWEAEQYITFGADESQISFFILGENEGGGKDAVVAAARIDLVENFAKILADAKVNIKVVDLSVFALANVFAEVYRDKIDEYDHGTLLLDMGAQTTKIIVYKRGGPIFSKELPIGGTLITEEIQRQMAVSYDEAEDLKTSGDDNGNLPQEILNIINTQVELQVAEIKRNISFYISQGSAERVEYCFATGGNSLLPGMIDMLSAQTGLEVKRMKLFPSIKIDDRKADKGVEHLSAISAIAVGLAMRKAD